MQAGPRLQPAAGGYVPWKPKMEVHLARNGADEIHLSVSTANEWRAMSANVKGWATDQVAVAMALAMSGSSSSKAPVISDEVKGARAVLTALVARSRRVHGVIFASLPDDIAQQAAHLPTGWAFGLWDWLEKKFQNTEDDGVEAMMREWSVLRMEESEAYDSYRARVSTLATRLEHAKEKPTARAYKIAMVDSTKVLPMFHASIMAMTEASVFKDPAAVDWDSVAARLNAVERKEALSQVDGSVMAVRGTWAKTAAGGNGGGSSASGHRITGTSAGGAGGSVGSSDSNGDRRLPMAQRKCHLCNQLGHLQYWCPNNEKGKADGPAEASSSVSSSTDSTNHANKSEKDEKGTNKGKRTGRTHAVTAAPSNPFDVLSSDDELDESDSEDDDASTCAHTPSAGAAAAGMRAPAVDGESGSPAAAGTPVHASADAALVSKHSWGVDTYASQHCCGNRHHFVKLVKCTPMVLTMANKTLLEVTLRGQVRIPVTTADGVGVIMTVDNVYYSDKFSTNLLSMGQLTKRGWELHITPEESYLKMPGGNKVMTKSIGHVSMLDVAVPDASAPVCSVGVVNTGDVDQLVRLHERLGHMGFDRMVTVLKSGKTTNLGRLGVDGPAMVLARRRVMECTSCLLGKGQRAAFGHHGVDKGTGPVDTLHMDTYHVALSEPGGRSWTEYGLVVTDPHSEYKWFERVTSKDQVAGRVIAIVRNAQTQSGRQVKRLFADGGTEFINSTLKTFCTDSGIELHYPPARTQQLNGVAERSVGANKNVARTLLHHAGTPHQFWWRAAHHATYVWNRSAVASATGVTPFECLVGRQPDARTWSVFGCDAFCHVPKEQRVTFEPKSQPCIYMGHDHTQNSAMVYVLSTGKIIASRDVVCRETSFANSHALSHGGLPVAGMVITDSDGRDGDEALLQGGDAPHDQDADADEEYEVERVIGRRVQPDGAVEYLVKWVGCSQQDSSWEPEHFLQRATELIEEYDHATADARRVADDVPSDDESVGGVAAGGAPVGPSVLPAAGGNVPAAGGVPVVHVAAPAVPVAPVVPAAPVVPVVPVVPAREFIDLSGDDPQPVARPPPAHVIPPRGLSQRIRGFGPDGDHGQVHMCMSAVRDMQTDAQHIHDTHHVACAVTAGVGLLDQQTPATYREATGGADAGKWRDSMDKEIASCAGLGAWEYVERADLLRGANVLPVKWVYKIKTDEHGNNHLYKSRITPKGFRQKHGQDFFAVYAATGMYKTMRVGLSLAAKWDHELEQLDVPTAFLNATVDEDIYMDVPEGYRAGKETQVCKLKKALYGLKQAPRNWYLLISAFIRDTMGFKACVSDPCLFFKRSRTKRLMLLFLFVDDMQVSFHEEDRAEWSESKVHLVSRFKTKDMGPSTWILGMRITRDRVARTITLDQELYVTKALERYGLTACKVASTPEIAHRDGDASAAGSHGGSQSSPAPGGVPADATLDAPADRDRYMEIAGTCIYAAVSTRLDCAHAGYALACHMQAPTRRDMQAAERLLRYLAGTRDIGLVFGSRNGGTVGDSRGRLNLQVDVCAFADADWANSKVDRRSITGWVAKLNGDPVSWASKKQRTVALSTCEAELYAEAAAIQEVLWLRGLLTELGLHTQLGSVVFGDNQSAIAVTANGIKGERTKHVDIKYHFITETAERGDIVLKWIPTTEMHADIFTKALAAPLFEHFRKQLMTR